MDELPDDLRTSLANVGWIATKPIGEGGGGRVFRCFRREALEALQPFMPHTAQTILSEKDKQRYGGRVMDTLYQTLFIGKAVVGALKLPHKVSDPKSIDRLKKEVKAMASVDHPALIKVLAWDEAEPPQWFVMHYHSGGTLNDAATKYKGNPLMVLRAVKPIVDGLIALHEKGYVHRDIKPSNIFVASDGHLVLGDFGIIFTKEDDRTRVTQPGELEFSRDWIPDWVRHKPIDDFSTSVDVFMLAKVIYFLVSGGRKVQATQIDEPDFDLRQLFPDTAGIDLLYDLLLGCITAKEKDCKIKEARTLLEALDDLESEVAQKRKPQLVFSRFETHSSIMIPIPMTGGMGYRPMLSGVVYLPRGSKCFMARARVINSNRIGAITLRFTISKGRSSEVRLVGDIPEPGEWTDVLKFTAPTAFNEDWYELAVEGYSTSTGAFLTAFCLYAI
jgi:serine/threonine protein kinase